MEEVRKRQGGRWEEGDRGIKQWKAIPGWLEEKEIQEVRAFENLDLRGQKMLLLNEYCTLKKKNKFSLSMNRTDFGCRQSLG